MYAVQEQNRERHSSQNGVTIYLLPTHICLHQSPT